MGPWELSTSTHLAINSRLKFIKKGKKNKPSVLDPIIVKYCKIEQKRYNRSYKKYTHPEKAVQVHCRKP